MSVESFVDTNVLVYHLEASDRSKFPIAERIVRDAVVTGNACISYQVVQECLNVILRKAKRPLGVAAAERYFDAVLSPLYRVPASPSLFRSGLELQTRYRLSFYDSMIVAAALEAGCTRLWSEDLQDGQKIGQLTIQNPFREKPGTARRRTSRG